MRRPIDSRAAPKGCDVTNRTRTPKEDSSAALHHAADAILPVNA